MWDENPYGIVTNERDPDPEGERVASLLEGVGMAPVAHHVRQRKRIYLDTATWEWFARERPDASPELHAAIAALRALLSTEGQLKECANA